MRRVWAISSARASSSMGKRPLPSGYARITEMLSRIHAQNRGAIHSGTSSCRASYFATSSAPSTPSGRHVSSLTAESLPHRTDLAARSWGLRRLLLCPNGIQTVPERVEGQSDDVEVDLALDDVVVEVAASAVVAAAVDMDHRGQLVVARRPFAGTCESGIEQRDQRIPVLPAVVIDLTQWPQHAVGDLVADLDHV